MVRSKLSGVFLAVFVLHAQYPPGQYPPGGQYPQGGQYPPGGQYPQGGGGGTGIPMPRIKLPKRKPKEPEVKAEPKPAADTLPSVDGTLRKLEEKRLTLETTAKGTLQFRLLAKTQFLDKDGKALRDSLLKPGDQLQVSFSADDEETALRVTLTRAGTAAEKAVAEKETAEVATAPAAPDTATRVSTPAKDDDKPVLRRGKQPQKPRDPDPDPAPAPEAKIDPREYKENPSTATAMGLNTDPIIEAAREAASQFTETLPDFIVQQHTMRYRTDVKPFQWQAIDMVSAEVTVIKGKEEYKKISINGKVTNKPVEKTGAWSTGEFATTQQDILDSFTAAKFVKRGGQRVAGRDAVVYDYAVQQPNSHWSIIPENSKAYRPPYKGAIWIDKETKRVLKIEQRATSFPDDFEFNRVELVLEYGLVRISGKLVLLPVRSENIICQSASTYCSRNELNFRNYRKFGADTAITFEKD